MLPSRGLNAGRGEGVKPRLGLAALAVVRDCRGVGVALEVGPRSDGRAYFLASFLHARSAVGHPVDVNELVVLAAIRLARRDRGRKRYMVVRSGVDVVLAGRPGDDGVVLFVATG